MVKSVEIDDSGKVDLAIFLTVSGLADEGDPDQGLEQRPPGARRRHVRRGRARRHERRAACGAPLPAARRGPPRRRFPSPSQQPHAGVCRRVRQGRRRQVVGDRQPRRGDGGAGTARGRRRRRRLRLLRAAHARGRAAPDAGRRHDPAAHQPRREGHLDRHVRPGQPAVVWRGPMLHARSSSSSATSSGATRRAAARPAAGTGDIAISVAQLIPTAEILVVTTPQQAAAEVAERGRFDRPADAPARRRRHREHELARAARRDPTGDLRVRGRPGGRRLADQGASAPRGAARPDPARHAPARGWRRRHTRRAGGARHRRCRGAARHRPHPRSRARGLAGRSLGLTPAGR